MNPSSQRALLTGREQLILVVGLVGIAIGALGVEQTHLGKTELIALVFVLLPLALGGPLLAGLRWAVTVAIMVAALYILGAVFTAGELSYLTHPAASWGFVSIVVELLSCVLVVVAGLVVLARQIR
jgi:hypothetical protein